MYEAEGLDRAHMNLPQSHDALIEAVSKVHSKVVVVLSNGSPVEMPWEDQVQGILEAYLGGQAGAGAIADILYGKFGSGLPYFESPNPIFRKCLLSLKKKMLI